MLVDRSLDGGISNGTNGGEHETSGDAGNGTEVDAAGAEEGVEDVVEEGNKEDDSQGVEVVEDIVWDTIGDESRRLEVGCCSETSVVDIGNGVEEEDSEEGWSIRQRA